MLPLGQLHQLWVVPILSTRGPHKDHAQLFAADNSQLSGTPRYHPISCPYWSSLISSSLTEWHPLTPPNHMSQWYSLIHGNQSMLGSPSPIFHTFSARAQSLFLFKLKTSTCKHVITMLHYKLLKCFIWYDELLFTITDVLSHNFVLKLDHVQLY